MLIAPNRDHISHNRPRQLTVVQSHPLTDSEMNKLDDYWNHNEYRKFPKNVNLTGIFWCIFVLVASLEQKYISTGRNYINLFLAKSNSSTDPIIPFKGLQKWSASKYASKQKHLFTKNNAWNLMQNTHNSPTTISGYNHCSHFFVYYLNCNNNNGAVTSEAPGPIYTQAQIEKQGSCWKIEMR